MVTTIERAQAALTAAGQAYQFNPGSYTYECLLHADKLVGALLASTWDGDWVREYLDWNAHDE